MLVLFLDQTNTPNFNGGRTALYVKSDRKLYIKSGAYEVEKVLAVPLAIIPAGGAIGQVLKKLSASDYDVGWSADLTEGGGAGVAWGAITGTLADQTDLQNALNGKAASVHTHTAADIISGLLAAARLGSGTANTNSVLRGDQTFAPLWSVIRKTADQTKTSDTTLAADSALSLALAANTKYKFRLVYFVTSHNTPNFKYRLTGPASPSVLIFDDFISTITGNGHTIFSAYHTVDRTMGFSGTSHAVGIIEGTVHNGANAGNLALQWAQNTSSVEQTIVRAGSYLEYMTF